MREPHGIVILGANGTAIRAAVKNDAAEMKRLNITAIQVILLWQ